MMLSLVAAVLLLGNSSVQATQRSPGPASDEYAIYTTVLNALFVTDESYVVINDHTTTKPIIPIKRTLRSASSQMRGGLSQQLQSDFETKNQVRYALEDRFNLSVKTILLNQSEIDRLIGNGDWIEFLKTYPGHGVIEFSRVGFNAIGDRALVYAGSQGGPKSG